MILTSLVHNFIKKQRHHVIFLAGDLSVAGEMVRHQLQLPDHRETLPLQHARVDFAANSGTGVGRNTYVPNETQSPQDRNEPFTNKTQNKFKDNKNGTKFNVKQPDLIFPPHYESASSGSTTTSTFSEPNPSKHRNWDLFERTVGDWTPAITPVGVTCDVLRSRNDNQMAQGLIRPVHPKPKSGYIPELCGEYQQAPPGLGCLRRHEIPVHEERTVPTSNFRQLSFIPIVHGTPLESPMAVEYLASRCETRLETPSVGGKRSPTVEQRNNCRNVEGNLEGSAPSVKTWVSECEQGGRSVQTFLNPNKDYTEARREPHLHSMGEREQDISNTSKRNTIPLLCLSHHGRDNIFESPNPVAETSFFERSKERAAPGIGGQRLYEALNEEGWRKPPPRCRSESRTYCTNTQTQVGFGKQISGCHNGIHRTTKPLETSQPDRTCRSSATNSKNRNGSNTILSPDIPWVKSIVEGFHLPKFPLWQSRIPEGYQLHAPKELPDYNADWTETKRLWYTAGLGHRWDEVMTAIAPDVLPIFDIRAKARDSFLDNDVLDQMCSTDVLSEFFPTDSQECWPTCTMWLRPEEEKRRMRIITWPRLLNYTAQYTPDVPLRDMVDILQLLHGNGNVYAATIDIKCSFFNYILPEKSWQFHRIRVRTSTGVRYFYQKRAAMGHVATPELLNSTMRAVTFDAKSFNVTAYTHIDNIILVGSKADVDRYFEIVMSRLKKARLTVGEQKFGSNISFLGMQWDFQFGTIHLGEKAKSKLLKIQSIITSSSSILTLQLYLHLVGTLNYYSRILWFYSTTNFWCDYFDQRANLVRILNTGLQLHERIPTDLYLYRRLHDWCCALMSTAAVPIPPLLDPPTVIYVTDASLTWGGAGAALRYNSVHVGKKRWSVDETCTTINPLELRSLAYAVEKEPRVREPPAATGVWLTDSQVDISILQKKLARSSECNNQLMWVLRTLATRNVFVTRALHINSDVNPMDNLSRGLQFTSSDHRLLCQIYEHFFCSKMPQPIFSDW